MYAITGVTGHVGAATAEYLLEQGARVRAVVRSPSKAQTWTRRGAESATADFNDPTGLAAALRGSDGAFVLLPTVATAGDAEHRRMAESIAAAVVDSGVPHVVLLSSLGADLSDGTGPIRWLHHLENLLRDTGVVLSTIRSCHFQEKVESVLDAALNGGIYPVFGEADTPNPMVATRDVGRIAAQLLLAAPAVSETIDLEGPHYTERQVAGHLAAVLGRPLEVVAIPRAGWVAAMLDAGLPAPLADELAELYDADRRGLLQPRAGRRQLLTTGLEDTLRRVVQTLSEPAAT